MRKFIFAGAMMLSAHAYAGLNGTELSLRTLFQATPMSTPIITSFERTVAVSSSTVEFPDVASLFNPGSNVPPGFALVNVAIDVGNDYVEIDFDNSGAHTRFASSFENTYVFRFDSAAVVDITGAQINTDVTTLGLAPSDVRFTGNELFINVDSLSFNPTTFARIDLLVQGGPPPIPEPATYAMLLAGLAMVGWYAPIRRRNKMA